MSWRRLFTLALLVSNTLAQNLPETKVMVTKLSAPIYPRLALQARIAVTVELNVAVRPDGSVDSVAVVSGHPLLIPAAIESAKRTEFQCTNCRKPLTPHRMTYKFELGEAIYCKDVDANGYGIYDANAGTQVSQSQDTITIVGRPFGTCDPAEQISSKRAMKAAVIAAFLSSSA